MSTAIDDAIDVSHLRKKLISAFPENRKLKNDKELFFCLHYNQQVASILTDIPSRFKNFRYGYSRGTWTDVGYPEKEVDYRVHDFVASFVLIKLSNEASPWKAFERKHLPALPQGWVDKQTFLEDTIELKFGSPSVILSDPEIEELQDGLRIFETRLSHCHDRKLNVLGSVYPVIIPEVHELDINLVPQDVVEKFAANRQTAVSIQTLGQVVGIQKETVYNKPVVKKPKKQKETPDGDK